MSHILKHRIQASALFMLATLLVALAGCGGGGGGGGGGATGDTTNPTVAFSSPSGTLSYEADPDDLPSPLTVTYSDASGVTTSSFAAIFNFRNQTFNLTSLFSPGSTSATTSESAPLYWTLLSKYSLAGALEADIGVFGVSSGSTGVLNHLDAAGEDNIVAVAAASRQKVILLTASTGAVAREISLTGSPIIVRLCPDQDKVFVALENSSNIYVYSTTTGSLLSTLTLPATPKAMDLNRVSNTAFIIYENTTRMTRINCTNNAVTPVDLSQIPQRIVVDGLSTNKIYYAGGIGGDKGVYEVTTSSETKRFSLSELPEAMAFDNTLNFIYLADFGNDRANIYNTASGAAITQTNVGDRPFNIQAANGRAKVFCLNKGSDSVSILHSNSGSVLGTINLSADPVGLAVDNTNSSVYVLQNLWDISSTTSGTLTASIRDKAGNTGTKTLNLSISPVVTGGPGSP